MGEPGDRRPTGLGTAPLAAPRRRDQRSWSVGRAFAAAMAVALGTAAVWALLRGILELGVGLLAVAAAGGWAVGATLRQASAPRWLAAALGGLAWLLGLILTWLVAMAVLPGSSRTFAQRVAGTPFVDWLAPQFGWLEVASLVLMVSAAAYGARASARPLR